MKKPWKNFSPACGIYQKIRRVPGPSWRTWRGSGNYNCFMFYISDRHEFTQFWTWSGIDILDVIDMYVVLNECRTNWDSLQPLSHPFVKTLGIFSGFANISNGNRETGGWDRTERQTITICSRPPLLFDQTEKQRTSSRWFLSKRDGYIWLNVAFGSRSDRFGTSDCLENHANRN